MIFCVITIAKNCRRVPLSEMPTVTPTSLANKAMKTFPVITIDVIRPVSNQNSCDCIESFHLCLKISRTSTLPGYIPPLWLW